MKKIMKHSIRHRIMLIFLVLMAAVLFSVWVTNNWWLERYYIGEKSKEMEMAYNDIDAAVMEKINAGEDIGDVIARELEDEWEAWSNSAGDGQTRQNADGNDGKKQMPGIPRGLNGNADGEKADPESGTDPSSEERTVLSVIRSYGNKNNIDIVLIDSNTGAAILGSGRDSNYLVRKVQRYMLGIGGVDSSILKKHENYVVERNYDPRSHTSFMEGWGFLSDNSTMFIMSMPLASIRESVELANRFTTTVGLIALVAGTILMYFVTRRVTTPIMRLAALSERMSRLDFDARYEGDSQDEIGVLGRSMNTLSSTLKETIGELQDANRQLQHDIEEKIQIDEMRKEFIANVSHELKTPISLIQGYAEGLSEGMCEDEESRNYYCEVIMDEAGKMNKMVKQLLTLSALESGGDMPVIEQFDITELIRDLISAAGILIQQKEAQVIFEPEGPLYVEADEFKIEEVVTNYLNNALNHLGGSRVIRISAGRYRQPEGEEPEQILVRVFNTGDPIPEEDIPNLWTKFYKVDKARTRAYGGSGIGLSIVKAVMDAHHQQCGVKNVDGGVEFWFTLKEAAEGDIR